MSVSVKRIVLWRSEVDNRPGALAGTLEPLAQAGADLRIVMGYRLPGDPGKAAFELYPVSTKKAAAAAQAAGLGATSIPTLLVEGDDKPGLGSRIVRSLADAGINVGFLVTQVIGRKYSSVFGFETEEDARRASGLIRKATKISGR